MIQVGRVDALLKKDGEFTDWEDREKFYQFRKEMFAMYEALTEEEQLEVDESMVMEHIAMLFSCYEGIEAAFVRMQNGEKITEEEREAIERYMN